MQVSTKSKDLPLGFSDRTTPGSAGVQHLASSAHVCEFLIDRLAQKRQVTIAEVAAQAVTDLGERLYVGGYDKRDASMVAVTLTEYVRYLQVGNGGLGSVAWAGPYLRPLLSAAAFAPTGFVPTPDQEILLGRCDQEQEEDVLPLITADVIDESELGPRAEVTAWAAHLRELPAHRAAYRRWWVSKPGTADESKAFYAIRWELAAGWGRKANEIPRLLNFGW